MFYTRLFSSKETELYGRLALQFFVTLPTSQLILQPFRLFTYVTAHSPPFRCFTYVNPSFASLTSQALHLRHMLFTYVTWRAAHASVMIPIEVFTSDMRS